MNLRDPDAVFSKGSNMGKSLEMKERKSSVREFTAISYDWRIKERQIKGAGR